MTVPSTTLKVQANGNGSTTAFSFPYLFLDNSHLQVYLTDTSTNVDTLQVINTNYTVAGAGVASGGTVTFGTAPAVGKRVTIRRQVPLTQDVDYTESGPFPAETHEQALDKLTMAAQQISELSSRAVVLKATSTVATAPTIDDGIANNLVGWNSTATGLENKGVSTNDLSVTSFFAASDTSPSTAPTSSGDDSLSIGNAAATSGTRAVSINKSYASGDDSTAIGIGDNTSSYGALAANSVAIGYLAKVGAGADKGAVIGGNVNEIQTTAGDFNLITGGSLNVIASTGNGNVITGGFSNDITGTGDYGFIAGSTNSAVSATSGVVLGASGGTASGAPSAVIGSGGASTASGANSVIIGGGNGTASGTSSVVIGGNLSTASQTYSATIGGNVPTASGAQSATVGGTIPTASGTNSVAIGGSGATATATGAIALGGAAASRTGELAHGSGAFSAVGDAQHSLFVLRRQTTSATPRELFTDGSSARMTIPTGTTWGFTIQVVARRTDADDESAFYKFEGCIDNNAGTTALVGSVVATTPIEDTAAWAVAVTADNTNDALIITVTGEAAKTINWVASAWVVQVTG